MFIHLRPISRCLQIELLSLTVFAIGNCFSAATDAQTIWTGPATSFTKPGDSDYTLPENQDPLTASVIFTRAETGGLINYATEASYAHFTSPSGTLWATDLNNEEGVQISAANYTNLSFASWIEAYGGQFSGGGNIVGRDAVVHLVNDNIYLNLTFSEWTSTRGGGFTYDRSTPAAAIVTTGDYNGDMVVNAADYTVWRNNAGASANPKGSGADGDGDGEIGPGDYLFWKERYGDMINNSQSVGSAAPEPGTMVLAIVAAIVVRLRRTPRL